MPEHVTRVRFPVLGMTLFDWLFATARRDRACALPCSRLTQACASSSCFHVLSGDRILGWLCCATTWSALAGLALSPMQATPETEAGLKFFREKIEPVLKRECYECHSEEAKKLKAGLRLDSRAALLAGGPAVEPTWRRRGILHVLHPNSR